jgi:hypothetical protein
LTPQTESLPEGHGWLRVADPSWADPLDPSYAKALGGRWNPPGSFATLYLNEDLETARAQVSSLLAGSPVSPEDLDRGFDLIVATLPRDQEVADAVSDDGLKALGLPVTYPRHRNGRPVRHEDCQPVGLLVKDLELRGVHARSAVLDEGRELAWFPARESSRATLLERLEFSDWWFFRRSAGEDVSGPERAS